MRKDIMTVLLFLTMRVLHVVLAGAWFGAAVFTTVYLGPAVAEAGLAGEQVRAVLVRRGVVKYMASMGGLTVVTGIYLFWRFTTGFDPALSASRAGMAFSIGALTGVIALALGGSMVGGSVKKIVALAGQAATLPEGAERAALMNTMNRLRARMAIFGRIVIVLLFISMAAMALGHYI
jgi:hypothetical protein